MPVMSTRRYCAASGSGWVRARRRYTDRMKSYVDAAFDLGVPRDYGRLRGLRRVREPERLASIGRDTQGREQYLAPRAANAWVRMRQAAALVGVELEIVSAFRSIEY